MRLKPPNNDYRTPLNTCPPMNLRGSFIGWLGLFFLLARRRWQLSFLFPLIAAAISLLLPAALIEFGAKNVVQQ